MELIKDNKKYIVQSAKDVGDFIRVKIKDDEAILIPLEDYFMMAIKLNSIIPNEIYQKYHQYQVVYQSYIKVKYRISQKDLTMFEIQYYCKKKLKLEKIHIDCIMDMVLKSNLVDDHSYAINKAKYFHDVGYSKNEIRQRLKKVGIIDNWIDEATSELEDDQEEQNAISYAKKMISSIKGKSLSQMKMTMIQKLTTKGFSYDLSKNVVESLSLKEDDNALLLTYNKAKRLYSKETEYNRVKKIRAYCMRKGFSLSQVNEILEGEE